MINALLICLADYGPAALLTLVALVLEQRREAPNGTDPAGNIVYRVVAGGMIIAGGAWVSAVLMSVLFGARFAYPPLAWMFALGEAIGFVSLLRARAPREPIDM